MKFTHNPRQIYQSTQLLIPRLLQKMKIENAENVAQDIIRQFESVASNRHEWMVQIYKHLFQTYFEQVFKINYFLKCWKSQFKSFPNYIDHHVPRLTRFLDEAHKILALGGTQRKQLLESKGLEENGIKETIRKVETCLKELKKFLSIFKTITVLDHCGRVITLPHYDVDVALSATNDHLWKDLETRQEWLLVEAPKIALPILPIIVKASNPLLSNATPTQTILKGTAANDLVVVTNTKESTVSSSSSPSSLMANPSVALKTISTATPSHRSLPDNEPPLQGGSHSQLVKTVFYSSDNKNQFIDVLSVKHLPIGGAISLKGKRVAIVGKLKEISRTELINFIQTRGGIPVTEIITPCYNLSIVICAAKELKRIVCSNQFAGNTVLSEADFLKHFPQLKVSLDKTKSAVKETAAVPNKPTTVQSQRSGAATTASIAVATSTAATATATASETRLVDLVDWTGLLENDKKESTNSIKEKATTQSDNKVKTNATPGKRKITEVEADDALPTQRRRTAATTAAAAGVDQHDIAEGDIESNKCGINLQVKQKPLKSTGIDNKNAKQIVEPKNSSSNNVSEEFVRSSTMEPPIYNVDSSDSDSDLEEICSSSERVSADQGPSSSIGLHVTSIVKDINSFLFQTKQRLFIANLALQSSKTSSKSATDDKDLKKLQELQRLQETWSSMFEAFKNMDKVTGNGKCR
jgi:hypothetical protein